MHACRGCDSTDLTTIFQVCNSPIAGSFPLAEEADSEVLMNMTLVICNACKLIQILETIPREKLFEDYRYLSSVSATLRDHFKDYARYIANNYTGHVVVEIGCNDGVLLRELNEYGFKIIGVDPALNITGGFMGKRYYEYFSVDLARRIRENDLTYIGAPRCSSILVTSSNTFAHIDNIQEALEGVSILIGNSGTFIFEVNYAVDILKDSMFDLIYHEHIYYHTVTSLDNLLSRFRMKIVDVSWVPMHGGVIRVTAKSTNANQSPTTNVYKFKKIEERIRVTSAYEWLHSYNSYLNYLETLSVGLLRRRQWSDKCKEKIVAYGAAGRANMLLNHLVYLGTEIDYVVDESPERYGRVLSKCHIPIYYPAHIYHDYPGTILISAWTYSKEIKSKERYFDGSWVTIFDWVWDK